MGKIILPENHWSFTACHDMRKMIDPILTQHGITCFVYGRLFSDGTACTLTTHAEGQLYHFNNEFVITMPTIISTKKNRTIALLHENDAYQEIVYAYRNYFNIDKMIGITDFYQNYIDMYFFAATEQIKNIVEFYLNNLDVLENFIDYFKNQAKPLIKKTFQHKIILTEKMFATVRSYFESTQAITQLSTPDEHNYILSKRELECIQQLMKGKTIKDTAQTLDLSPRTVEFYLKNIRTKLNCHKKADIIDFVIKNNLITP